MKPVKKYADGTLSNRCRVCGCSKREPCNPPCGWYEEDLCTLCALVIEAIAEWLDGAHWANRAALWREAKAAKKRLGE